MLYGIDIFSGAGGLSLGAEMVGIKISHAVEIQGMENAVHYKINKIFQRLNIEDIEEEEVDDAD